jgi:hypothetical protein
MSVMYWIKILNVVERSNCFGSKFKCQEKKKDSSSEDVESGRVVVVDRERE